MVARPAALVLLAALPLVPSAAAADPLPGGRAIVATTSLTPDTHLFAEPVVARLDVVVDPRLVDPDRIRVRLRFAPYELVGPIEERRRTVGDLVQLRYVATLRCLHVGCIAKREATILGEQEAGRAERASFEFPPAEIRQGKQFLLRRRFPVVEVVSRINTAQAEGAGQPFDERGRFFASRGQYVASGEPPAPTYRLAPTALAAVALGAAFVLFLFPAALVGRALHARWIAARRPPPLSPLERALALIAWTGRQEDGEPDRRKALEVLALVLEHGGAKPLAEAARELAWADEAPQRDRADELAVRARDTLTGGGNGRAS